MKGSAALLLFSLPDEPGTEPIRSSSSSPAALLFLPQTLQATTAIAPSRIAPPTPPTTPPMTLLDDAERPEEPPEPLLPLNSGGNDVADAAATTVLEV